MSIPIRQLIHQATKYLEDAQIPTAKIDAEILLCNLIGTDRVSLYLNKETCLNENRLTQYWKLLDRRASHEPVAYILGKKEFMDWEFAVNSKVLIPRPETEILVEEVIKIANSPLIKGVRGLSSPLFGARYSVLGIRISPEHRMPNTEYRNKGVRDAGRKLVFVDIGTGSGVIAISLALTLNATIYAIDISPASLEVAKANAAKLGVEDKITFLEGDLLSPINKETEGKFGFIDFIVSNPPYVSTAQFEELPRDVRFEPRIALDGGENGLTFYDRIITDSLDYLKEDGYLALEVGFNQSEEITHKIKQTKKFKEVQTIKDYQGIDRVILARKGRYSLGQTV